MIGILTDFGIDDIYVGIMKGVINSIAPNASIVDITHSIEPYNLLQGSFVLNKAFAYLPDNMIIVAVIDPGVGSDREPIACLIDNKIIVCPNNGIITYLMQRFKIKESYLINPELLNQKISNTFHGRDVFAPFAAKIYNNREILSDFEKFPIDKIKIIDNFLLQKIANKLIGQIAHIDRFGNLISNIEPDFNITRMRYKFHEFESFSKTYSDVDAGSPLIYVGSFGYYEIAVNSKSAKKYFNARIGDKITAFWE
jgi:S-adenosyl-L-methionine hydrolase (adenosine-forming)